MTTPHRTRRGLLAALLLTAVSAHASLIQLTGGDAGEGYAPLGATFAAVDTGGAGGLTVQGVLFTASHPNLSLSAVGTQTLPIFLTAPFASTTSNDANLLALGNNSVFGNPGSFTLTISGLNPGTLYQVDSFIGLDPRFAPRDEQVTAVGLFTITDSLTIGAPDGVLFDVRQTLLPTLAGQIVVTYSGAGANSFFPNLNAISVTTAPPAVPEPGTALAGVVLAGLCGTVRRRRSREG